MGCSWFNFREHPHICNREELKMNKVLRIMWTLLYLASCSFNTPNMILILASNIPSFIVSKQIDGLPDTSLKVVRKNSNSNFFFSWQTILLVENFKIVLNGKSSKMSQ